MEARGDRTEGIVWGGSGAVLLGISIILLTAASILMATVPDPEDLESQADFEELQDRFRLTNHLIDIGQPGAIVGAIGLFTGAALLRTPGRPHLFRLAGGGVLILAATTIMIAGWQTTNESTELFSTAFRAWAWVEAVSWLVLAGGVVLTFMGAVAASKGETTPDGPETAEGEDASAGFSVRDRS